MSQVTLREQHGIEALLRQDRMPHIWCPGCGLGTVLHCFLSALLKSGLPLDKVAMVSGIGCTARAAGYVKLDGFHVTHGRAIPFATGMRLANPELNVAVFSGDGDLVSIGGNHFIHAARRNIDMTVICVNNFNYGMTGGQFGPTTPLTARTTTTPYGSYEHPFNVPLLAAMCGAVYVARWTALHVRRLEQTITEALMKRGFRLIEVISPCPTVYGRMNREPSGLDQMTFYRENSVVRHGADPRDVGISLGGKIVVGRFIDVERSTFSDLQAETLRKSFASKGSTGAGR
ncbi:MAG: thiamine pyrophosphate-dependent enzyme [Chloroflexota bacterium]